MKQILGTSLMVTSLALLPACSGDDSDDTGASSDGTTTDTTSDGTTTDATTTDSGTGGTTDATGGTTDASTGGTGGSTGGAASTMIRVMHLGVGVPGVDVFANETEPAAVSDLDYREGTGYLELPADAYTFQVSLTGMTPADAAITAGPLDLAADTKYTAVAVGDLDDGNLEILPLVDDSSGLDAANIRLQVTHAAPAVGQVDIWNVTDPNSPAALLEDVDYKASGTVDVPPGSYDLGIDVDNDMMPDLVYTVDISAIPAGSFLNVFANNDNEDPAGVALVALVEDADGTTLVIDPN